MKLLDEIYALRHKEIFEHIKRVEKINSEPRGVRGAYISGVMLARIFNLDDRAGQNILKRFKEINK